MKQFATITFFLAILLSINSVMVTTAQAEGADWCYIWDFSEVSGADIVTPIDLSYPAYQVAYTGWRGYDSGGSRDGLDFNFSIPATVTHVSATITISNNATNTRSNGIQLYDDTMTELYNGIIHYQSSGTYEYTYTGTMEDVDKIRVRLGSRNTGSHATLTNLEMYGTGDDPIDVYGQHCEEELPDLYKPLSQYEIDSAYEIDELELINNYLSLASYSTLPHTSLSTLAVSRTTDAKVHNVIDGSVTEVRPLQVSDCASFGLDGDQFFIDSSGGIDGNFVSAALAIDCSFLFESEVSLTFLIASLSQAITNPLRDKYYVEILGDDDITYSYLVENAQAYITDGDTVAGGCQIGNVLSTSSVGIELDSNPFSYELEEGFSFVRGEEDSSAVPIADRMVLEPENSQPCNAPSEYPNCVGDMLDTPSQWSTSSGQWLPDGGIRLPSGARVYTNPPLVIDSNKNPKLRVHAQTTGGSGQLTATLGQTSAVFSIGSVLSENLIPGDTHQADAGSLYTVSYKNTGTSAIDVMLSCLSFTTLEDGTTPDPDDYTPPPVCLFDNSSFNDGTLGWFVTNAEAGDGSVKLLSTGTVTQARELVGDSDDFTVSATTALWYYNSYTPDPENSTGGVTIEYQINGGGWQTIDSEITYGEYAQSNNRVQAVDTFNTSTVSGDFQFRATLASAPTGVRGVELLDVCINAGTEYNPDEDFPEPDGTPPTPPTPPFAESCKVITQPSGNDIGQWIYYHWQQLDNFFQCDLMRFLNSLFDLVFDIYQLAGWGMRWGHAMIQTTFDWIDSNFIPWLGGYLSNISPGQVVLQNEASCHDLFCAITAFFNTVQSLLDMINTVLDFLINVIGAIISIGLDLVQLLINALQTAQLFFQTIIGSWIDATPIVNPYLPTCSVDPRSNGLCIFLWFIENTILSGTGALLIPLLISYGGITWMLWAVKELKTIIIATGQGL